jgi:hypothetical protein
LNWEGKRERAEDESAIVELDVPKDEASAATDGIEGLLVGPVRRQRVVVTIQYNDSPGGDHGVHGGGLLSVRSDGEEALPVYALQGGAGAIVLEP